MHFDVSLYLHSVKTCSRNLARKGELSVLGNKDEPIFRGYVLPDQPELLVIFYSRYGVS